MYATEKVAFSIYVSTKSTINSFLSYFQMSNDLLAF